MEDYEYKVYCYFLKSQPNSLYAFTINKDYKKEFERFRNMDLFNYGYKIMDKFDFSTFSNKHKTLMLTTDVLTSNKRDYKVICTPVETEKLNRSIENIIDELTWLDYKLNEDDVPIKKKYVKFLKKIIYSLETDNESHAVNVDTLKIFYCICKETFTQVDDEDIKYQNILL